MVGERWGAGGLAGQVGGGRAPWSACPGVSRRPLLPRGPAGRADPGEGTSREPRGARRWPETGRFNSGTTDPLSWISLCSGVLSRAL